MKYYLQPTIYSQQLTKSVDLWGVEPQTFGMQIRRSSQLSYRPWSRFETRVPLKHLFSGKKNHLKIQAKRILLHVIKRCQVQNTTQDRCLSNEAVGRAGCASESAYDD